MLPALNKHGRKKEKNTASDWASGVSLATPQKTLEQIISHAKTKLELAETDGKLSAFVATPSENKHKEHTESGTVRTCPST